MPKDWWFPFTTLLPPLKHWLVPALSAATVARRLVERALNQIL